MARTRPPFKIHGGKAYLCDWVVDNFPPDHRELNYVEPFGGAASVLLNKPRARSERYNDLHGPTANIFHCLKDHPEDVESKLRAIEYGEESFLAAKSVPFGYGCVDSAVAEIVVRRMSRGGMKKSFSWSDRLRGGRPGDLNAWETFKDTIPKLCERLKGVEVSWKNATEVIGENSLDHSTLFYLDPPYVRETRTVKDVYDCEMSGEEHEELASLVKRVVGLVVVSGYDGPLYRSLYKDWNWVRKEVPNNSGQGKTKQRRVEWLVKNY